MLRFTFTIREVLWLTVVVGMCLAWFAEYRQNVSENHRLQLQIAELEYKVHRAESRLENFQHEIIKEGYGIINNHIFKPSDLIEVPLHEK